MMNAKRFAIGSTILENENEQLKIAVRILSKQNSKEEAIRRAISLAYRERNTCEIILDDLEKEL